MYFARCIASPAAWLGGSSLTAGLPANPANYSAGSKRTGGLPVACSAQSAAVSWDVEDPGLQLGLGKTIPPRHPGDLGGTSRMKVSRRELQVVSKGPDPPRSRVWPDPSEARLPSDQWVHLSLDRPLHLPCVLPLPSPAPPVLGLGCTPPL